MKLYGRDLDRETRMRCKAMEDLLRKAMAGRGEPARRWGLILVVLGLGMSALMPAILPFPPRHQTSKPTYQAGQSAV